MSRGNTNYKRVIAPDPKFNSVMLARFINFVMLDGKKTIAERIVYKAIETLGQKKDQDGFVVFKQGLDAISPQVEVRSRRVGGSNYQVPMPVSGERQKTLAFRWLIAAAKSKKGKGMADCIAQELLDALEGTGTAFKKKEDVHRMAEANKAFAHFARFGGRR